MNGFHERLSRLSRLPYSPRELAAPWGGGILIGTMVCRPGWLTVFAAFVAGAPGWAASKGSIRSCQGPERVPRLDSYRGIAPQMEFYVDVKWKEPGEFVPIAPVKMPYHHSSRLEWTNLERWPALRQRHGAVLRFRFKCLAAKIEKVPNQYRWWAAYSAEIEDVCLAPIAIAPAPG